MGLKKLIMNRATKSGFIDKVKKTSSFDFIQEYRMNRYITKKFKKNEYAKLKCKNMNYLLERRGKLVPEVKEILLNRMFEKQVGYSINFRNPKTFNEKIMWMKVYYHNPLITKCCDKFALKDYVKNVIGEEYVVPVLDSWTNAENIKIDHLPERFVMKVNWASGYLKIVKDKKEVNLEELKHRMARWMEPQRNGYYQAFNWGYKDMPPIVFAEEYMEQKDGQLYDYKFFCFNGKPELMFIAMDRFVDDAVTSHDFFDMDFNPLDITYGKRAHVMDRVKKTANFDKMKELAAKLAKPFPFARVDFYECNGQIYVGEMTFYPGGALLPFEPIDWDYKLGEMLELPSVVMPNREDYYAPLTPREAYFHEDKITRSMQEQYCYQKGYAQMGYFPDLKNPKSFNEKIIWLALNYKNPDIKIGADKASAKKYISDIVGKKYVVPLLGTYTDVNEIDFDKLPDKFVCKSSDGWGANEVILVKNKNTYPEGYLKTQLSTFLYPWSSYYYQNMCITDEKVESKIVIEEMLESKNGVDDYKFYCCNGEPKFALVVSGRGDKHQTRTFVDIDWNIIPVTRKGKPTNPNPRKPENLKLMLDLCRKLANKFPLVRIDFYEVDGNVYVGELTFTPGMFLSLKPIEMDYKLGELLDISELVEKYNKEQKK